MIRDWGVHPLVPIAVLTLISIAAWKACDADPRVAYGLAAVAVLIPSYATDRSRHDFLRLNFPKHTFLKIRLFESLIVSSLPILILIAAREFLLSGAALLLILLSTFSSLRVSTSLITPTPFARWPFEFTRGFRRTWPFYFIAVFLLVMAVRVGNTNLGLFSLLIPFLMALSYYMEPEEAYFVWIHDTDPKVFLQKKIKTALVYSLALSLPLVIAHGLFFPESIQFILLIPIAGIIWVMTSLLAKYAHFPSELNLLQGFAVLFTIIFPPSAILVVPMLYMKAIRNLETYLP